MPSVDDLPPPGQLQSSGIDDLPPPSAGPKAQQVYDQPIGPEQNVAPDTSGVINQVRAMIGKDPIDWNKAAARQNEVDLGQSPRPIPVAGNPPMVAPAGALGAFGKAAVALGEGQGLGYAAGRTALAAGQGAAMSAMDGQPGESWQDKIDRAKGGAKLSGGIQLAAESLPYVGKALGWGARRIGQSLTGVDDKLIENYAKRTDEVNKLIKENGGDITTAADQVRSELSQGIQNAKGALNGKISAALEGASPDASIPAQSIIDRLEAARSKLNPNFKKAAIADIDEMIGNIKAQAKDGMLDASGLYETKQYLGAESKGAYNKGGQIFTRASEAARAAKEAGGEARDLVKTHIPEIAEADAQLSKMHSIEGRLNRNLLAPGKPDAALLAAGSGANPRNAANLRALEEISGVNASQRTKDLATAKEFASASILPKGGNGKMVAHMLAGAAAGGVVDRDNPIAGMAAGAAFTSPMALKGVINAANIAGKVGAKAGIPQVAQAIRQNPFMAQTVAQLGASQIRRANSGNPMSGSAPGLDAPPPPALMQNGAGVDRSPAIGNDKHAQHGLQQLGIQDEELANKIMQDPDGIRLLHQASGLSPGSKAMKNLMNQIKAKWGTNQ